MYVCVCVHCTYKCISAFMYSSFEGHMASTYLLASVSINICGPILALFLDHIIQLLPRVPVLLRYSLSMCKSFSYILSIESPESSFSRLRSELCSI